MRVIREPMKSQEVEVNCSRATCRAAFAVTVADAYRETHDQRDGDGYVFKCQFCGQDIYADWSLFWRR